MATDYTRQWIQFFTGCGIPDDVAATYGLIFNENRIQKNMLLDLNKEYLRDMGITVMGDVIAILRGAKVAHDKYVREQILSDAEERAFPDSYDRGPSSKKPTPAKRILGHYAKKYDAGSAAAAATEFPEENVQICIENEKSVVKVGKKLTRRICGQTKVEAKKKIEAPPLRADEELAPVKLEVPVPKSRRLLPETEGTYRIKMPSGTTERSKKLLEKAKLTQSKTVFDRLGESSVSSSSDVTTTAGAPASKSARTTTTTTTTPSVFSRLGEKSPLVTSTSSNGDFPEQNLPYRGILKASPASNKSRLSPNATGTMRADDEVNLVKTSTKVKKIDLVKERLGSGAKPKRNRLRIATDFDEGENGESQMDALSKRFRSMKTAAALDKKDILDGLGSFRSEGIKVKSAKVSSTTQLSIAKRGVKRRQRVEDEDGDVADSAAGAAPSSKKVRFGRTTQRLIPANATEQKAAATAATYQNLTMVIGEERRGGDKSSTLSSGIRIGALNSDRMRHKPSMKDRIGGGAGAALVRRSATDIRRKRSLKFANRLKKGISNIHERLG